MLGIGVRSVKPKAFPKIHHDVSDSAVVIIVFWHWGFLYVRLQTNNPSGGQKMKLHPTLGATLKPGGSRPKKPKR